MSSIYTFISRVVVLGFIIAIVLFLTHIVLYEWFGYTPSIDLPMLCSRGSSRM